MRKNYFGRGSAKHCGSKFLDINPRSLREVQKFLAGETQNMAVVVKTVLGSHFVVAAPPN